MGGLLTGAGIRNLSRPAAATPARSYGPEVARSIYVREDELDRAREVLAQARGESGEAPGGGRELEDESTARSGELGGLLRRVGDALRRHDADHDEERTP